MLRFIRRQLRYRIKKRTFVVLAISLTVTMAVAALLAVTAVWLVGPANELQIEIAESDRRNPVLGAGVDCASAPSGNFLVDASFEPVSFREMLTVYEGDTQTMTVSDHLTTQDLYGDGFFDGASARVLSPAPEGLVLKKTAKVADYRINRVGQFQAIQLPADLPAGRQILDFADRGNDALAIGEQGLILKDLASAHPAVVATSLTSNLTGICASSAGYLACSDQGDLIYSTDGSLWTSWPLVDPKPLRAVAVSDRDLYVAVGDTGLILTGKSGQLVEVHSPTSANLTDVVYGQGAFLALAEDGTVLRSTTGTLWEIILRPESTTNFWRTIDYRNGTFALAGDSGLVATSQDGRNFALTAATSKLDIRDLVLLTSRQIIVLGADNQFQYTNDGGQTWTDSSIKTGLASQRIALLGDNHIVSTGISGQLGLAPLVIEIKLDNPLVSGSFSAGDLLFLEKSFDELPDSAVNAKSKVSIPGLTTVAGSLAEAKAFTSSGWEVFGADAERTHLSSPDEGGQSSLHLSAPAADSTVILSQRIDPALFARGNGREIYQVELWMRQQGIEDQNVKIWLSGDFTAIGTTIDHVGATWKKYTHTFVLPTAIIHQSGEVRLNISYSGKGELWLDRVFLGLSEQLPFGLDLDLINEIRTIQPSVLRLSYLPLGRSQLASGQWAMPSGNDAPVYRDGQWQYPSGQALSSAMKLAEEGHSDPWLVIDSNMSEDELLSLLEYMVGPISSPIGQLRMNQGRILPWTEQFNRIYLEICDTEQRFNADFLRADYVDWLIETISQSPYFNELKNQLVLVDGMDYSDGVWRSTADYHVSALEGQYLDATRNGIDEAILDYYDQMPRNPSQSRQGWYELISPVTYQSSGQLQPTLADILTLQLKELGTSAGVANLSITMPTASDYRAQDAVAAQIAALTRDSVVLNATSPENTLKAFAFRTDTDEMVVLANIGQQPQTARISGIVDPKDKVMTSFDQDGTILRERRLRASRDPLTILPGGVVILRKTP